MFRTFGSLALLLLSSIGLAAQSPPRHWGVDLLLARDAFTGASTDSSGAVEIAPDPRIAWELGLSWLGPHWGLRLSGGFATGGLRGKNGPLSIDDKSTSVDRYRGTLLLERILARGDQLRLGAVLGPTLDRWESAGIGNRTLVGARGGLHLGIVLGRLSLEQMAVVGLSSSPFPDAAVAATGSVRALWTWSVGAGLRLGI